MRTASLGIVVPMRADRGASIAAAPVETRRLILEIFPVTILLALQYGTLVALPAVLHGTAPESTILAICGLGVFTAFVVEGIRAPIGPRAPRRLPPSWSGSSIGYRTVPATWSGARAVMVIGWAAVWAAAFVGHGTYAAVIGTTSTSKFAAALTPFDVWPLIGLALSLGLWREGRLSQRSAYVVVAVNLVLQLAVSFYDARLAPFMSFALAVAFLMTVTRLIRLRWVVLALLVIPLVWPVMYDLRNDIRTQQGAAVAQYSTTNPSHRLRLDLEMAQLAELPQIPADIGQASVPTLLRFGLIPRVFDPGRGTISSANGLSVALGGSPQNSQTETALGSAYVEHKWPGIVVYVGIAALVVGMVIRRRGPWALAVLAILVQSGLWIEASYPDMLAEVLQALVSLVVAVAVVNVLFRSDRRAIGQADTAPSSDPAAPVAATRGPGD